MTKNIDWGSLGFQYQPTDCSVSAIYKMANGVNLKLLLTTQFTSQSAHAFCSMRRLFLKD